MTTNQLKFILAIVFQVLIILAIIIFKVAVFSGGRDILLRIEPIDPRDLLRGNYITFRYQGISNIDSALARTEQIRKGDTVYVVLEQNEKYWIARSVQKTKPAEGEVFIKGKVAGGEIEPENTFSDSPPWDWRLPHPGLNIVYGIEEYFIPEGRGQEVNFGRQEVAARVAVDENGNAVLKQIYINGKPWP
jgi:uncharacterized membrane-anchored protein